MKWTNASKEKAIEMISKGIAIEKIAKEFSMSKSSVVSLKYSTVNNHTERLKCEICGKILKQITVRHLNDHNISLEEYKLKYPTAKTITNIRLEKYQSFKHPNKGKKYDEIYGEKEALIKRNKISEAQIGREAPQLVGTGITGTRKDTNMFARSSYEANIDRIFSFENKKICGEFSEPNKRFKLLKKDGTETTYQPDRVDLEGLFCKDAFIEIKGYMYPEDWEKICLFREQNPDLKLLVISRDSKYFDVNYSGLESQYKNRIPLWEDEYQNYKLNPEIYQIDYIEPEIIKFFRENYENYVIKSIINEHARFISEKCVSYCSVRLGKKVYIDEARLLFISDRRPKSRVSTGDYHYELWEVITHNNEKYYITNQEKTTIFYCYEENRLEEIKAFFDDNNFSTLKFGAKKEFIFDHIKKELIDSFARKDILKRIESCFSHKAIPYIVEDVKLFREEDSKRGSINKYEAWTIKVNSNKFEYVLSNFGNTTTEYNLTEIIKD
jgi:hypothetical protein